MALNGMSFAYRLVLGISLLACGAHPPVPSSRQTSVVPEPRAEEGYWAIRGTRLRYRILGSGPTLVLLHGGPGGNMGVFTAFEGLSDTYRLVLYDQRGAGASDRFDVDPEQPESTPISVDENVEDLEAIRRQLGLARLTLIGHSWGGTLAAFYAAKYPSRVKRMVIYNGGPVDPAMGTERRAALNTRLGDEARVTMGKRMAALQAGITTWSQSELDAWFVEMGSLFTPGGRCDGKGVPPKSLGRGGFWANVLSNRYEQDFEPESFLRDLSSVQAPSLLTWGRCETNPIRRQVQLRDALPNAQMVIFEHSGHLAHEEEPALFDAVLRAFLADEKLPVATFEGKARATSGNPR